MGKIHFTGFPFGPSGNYVPTEPVGTVFYVNSSNGTDSTGYGATPDAPFATLKFALGSGNTNLTANNGDVIYVCPGHTEAVIGAGTITTNKAGVSVIGLGTGRLRPVITYTTNAAASVNITAANTFFQNVVFSAVGVASVTAAVNISAADVWLDNCEFELANVTNQAVLGILTTAAANRMRITNCHFHGTTNAGTTNAIQIVGGSDSRIEDCLMIGNYSTTLGAIQIVTTAAVNLMIKRCDMYNATASSQKVIVDTITGTTGRIASCGAGVLNGTAPFTAATMWWSGSPSNYYAAAQGSIDVIQ